MNINNCVGFPIKTVKKELEKFSIKYKIVESSDIQKDFDTILVVKATQKEYYVELVTDKFMLNI